MSNLPTPRWKTETYSPVKIHDSIILDTKKFGSYLQKISCNCPCPELLCYVAKNCCHCTVTSQHAHCKHCGGIFKVDK